VVSKPLRSDFFMRKHAELKIHLRKIKPHYHINFAVVIGKIIESCV